MLKYIYINLNHTLKYEKIVIRCLVGVYDNIDYCG